MVGFFVNLLVESLHYDVKIFVKLVHRQASTLTCYNFLNHKFNCFFGTNYLLPNKFMYGIFDLRLCLFRNDNS